MSATLRINEEQTDYELQLPDSEDVVTGEIDLDEESGEVSPDIIHPDGDTPGYLVIPGNVEGLKTYGVYQLVPVEVVLELNADLDDDDEDDEDEDEGEEVPA